MYYFVNVFLLPFTKVLCEYCCLQKDSLQKIEEKKVVSEFSMLAQKWSKMLLFGVGKPPYCASIKGELAGGGSVAVAVGISDM